MNSFVCRRFRPGQSTVGGVFFGRGFRRKNAVLRLVLGADIGILHPLGATADLSITFTVPLTTSLVLMSGIAAYLRRGYGDPLGDNDHAPVFASVFAGGERDQLVAVFRHYAGVVEGKRLALSDIAPKSSAESARVKW